MKETCAGSNVRTPVAVIAWSIPLLLAGAIVYILAAALSGTHKAEIEAAAPPTPGFPRIVKLPEGKQVAIPRRPERIVPCNAGTADILSGLVDAKRIAAMPDTVEEYAGAKAFYRAHPEIQRFTAYNAESLLSFKPDLILTSSFHDPTTTAALQRGGVPIIQFQFFQTFAAIHESIVALGDATGEEAKALVIARRFDERLAELAIRVDGKPRPRVLAYSNYGSGTVVGSGESQDEVIRRAGAINAAAAAGLHGHVPFTFEQILKLNPDWLVVVGEEGMKSKQVQILLNEPALKTLPAMKNNKIAVIPDRYFSALSQFIVDAVESLAQQLHPEAFPDPSPSSLRGKAVGR